MGTAAAAAAPPLGPAPRGAASPLVPPDPRGTLVDLWLPGALAPRPLRLPAGARLADLLAAA
ncbi:MAG TPA: hypothetical protein VFX28_18565, partial [Methylomirabilota bacterium]|nr:hypothetical protein [Methylomirabilota bacterium]